MSNEVTKTYKDFYVMLDESYDLFYAINKPVYWNDERKEFSVIDGTLEQGKYVEKVLNEKGYEAKYIGSRIFAGTTEQIIKIDPEDLEKDKR